MGTGKEKWQLHLFQTSKDTCAVCNIAPYSVVLWANTDLFLYLSVLSLLDKNTLCLDKWFPLSVEHERSPSHHSLLFPCTNSNCLTFQDNVHVLYIIYTPPTVLQSAPVSLFVWDVAPKAREKVVKRERDVNVFWHARSCPQWTSSLCAATQLLSFVMCCRRAF